MAENVCTILYNICFIEVFFFLKYVNVLIAVFVSPRNQWSEMSSCASLEALDTSHDGKISYCLSIWVDAMPEEHDGHRWQVLLMEEILHQFISSSYHFLHCLSHREIPPRRKLSWRFCWLVPVHGVLFLILSPWDLPEVKRSSRRCGQIPMSWIFFSGTNILITP